MMRISDKEKNEIIRTAQQTFKSNPEADAKFDAYPLEQLRDVDEMLGDRDVEAGFRIRIRNRISALETHHRDMQRISEKVEDKHEQRSYEKTIRIWSLVTAFVIGVVVTIFSQWLWGMLSSST